MTVQRLAFAGQNDEDGLSDILGKGRFAHLAQGCRIDQINVTLDQGGEGVVGAVGSVVVQQLLVGRVHLHLLTPGAGEKGQDFNAKSGTGDRGQEAGGRRQESANAFFYIGGRCQKRFTHRARNWP